MLKSTFTLATALLICIFVSQANAQGSGWGWKMATDPNDVKNFLNSKAPYTQKIRSAEITAVNKGSHIEFIIFYRSGKATQKTGGWGWKKATDPNDVKDFLSGQGAYQEPVKEAKVVAMNMKTYTEYYVFFNIMWKSAIIS